MKQIAAITATALALAISTPMPLIAQDIVPGEDDGFDLMEQGAQLLLRGLLTELAPAFDELEGMARELEPALQKFVTQMGPAMSRLLAVIDDIDNYEAPEILENGDIIIRRRPDAPLYEGPLGEEPEIEI